MKTIMTLALVGLLATVAMAQGPVKGGSGPRGPVFLSDCTWQVETFKFEVTKDTDEETLNKLSALRKAKTGRGGTSRLRMEIRLSYIFFPVKVKEKDGKEKDKQLVMLLDRECAFFGMCDNALSWEDPEDRTGFLDPDRGMLTSDDEFRVEIGSYEVDPKTGMGEFWFMGEQTIEGVQFNDFETFAIRAVARSKEDRPLEGKDCDFIDPEHFVQVHSRSTAGINSDVTNSLNPPGKPGEKALYDRFESAVGNFDRDGFLLDPIQIVIDQYHVSLNPHLFGLQDRATAVIAPQEKRISFPGIKDATFAGEPEASYHGTVIDADGAEVGKLSVNRETPDDQSRFGFVEFEFLRDYMIGASSKRAESFRKGEIIVFRMFTEEVIEDD